MGSKRKAAGHTVPITRIGRGWEGDHCYKTSKPAPWALWDEGCSGLEWFGDLGDFFCLGFIYLFVLECVWRGGYELIV